MKKRMVLLFLLCLVAGYTFFWFKGAERFKNELVSRLATLGFEEKNEENLTIGGYPFAYEAKLKNPHLSWFDPTLEARIAIDVEGVLTCHYSFLSDLASLQQTGQSLLTLQYADDPPLLLDLAGDLKLLVHASDFTKGSTLIGWEEMISHFFRIEAKNFTLTAPVGATSSPFTIKDSVLEWSFTRKGETIDYKINLEADEFETLKAHGTFPLLSKEALIDLAKNPSWTTFPSFSFVIDSIDSSTSNGVFSGKNAFSVNNQKDFVDLAFSWEVSSQFSAELQEEIKKNLLQIVQKDPQEIPDEQKVLYSFVKEHLEDFETLIPDFASLGKVKNDLDFELRLVKGEDPSSPKAIFWNLKKLDWVSHPYVFSIENKFTYEEGAAPSATAKITIDDAQRFIDDLTAYGMKFYLVVSENSPYSRADISTLAPKIGEKVRHFLEKVSTPSNQKNRLVIDIDAEDSQEIKIGSLPLSEFFAEGTQVAIQEILPLFQKKQ